MLYYHYPSPNWENRYDDCGIRPLCPDLKKEFSSTDVLLPKAQKEVSDFAHSIAAYAPDLICVEVLPSHQQEIDSLYALYVQNKLDFRTLEDGRSEVYQIAFRIAKERTLKKIYCVNAPGGTSQSILDNGDYIDLHKKEELELRAFATSKVAELQKGTIGFKFSLLSHKPKRRTKATFF